MRHPDPAIVEALEALLAHHVGSDAASSWGYLLHRINCYPYALDVRHVRRLQEAAEVLLDRGLPVVGLSGSGVFVARTVDELDAAIQESERRAKMTLTRRRRLRRARLAMLGQTSAVLGGTR